MLDDNFYNGLEERFSSEVMDEISYLREVWHATNWTANKIGHDKTHLARMLSPIEEDIFDRLGTKLGDQLIKGLREEARTAVVSVVVFEDRDYPDSLLRRCTEVLAEAEAALAYEPGKSRSRNDQLLYELIDEVLNPIARL